jgi:E3 ubiquitin-protein ligase UBR1
MIAQIRAGLWVRNGFPIRSQLLHYRDFILRELCYDQNLFILQSSLIILDRFGLLSFFRGDIENTPYEGTHLLSMVEEFLYVLITIIGERACATKLSFRCAIRHEIVHALASGPRSFTDLAKRVSERMVDDVSFERILKDVSRFRALESTSDTGVYELKDEAYDDVDPFTFHYTRNKREEVEVILENRLRKKTGVEDPVIVPTDHHFRAIFDPSVRPGV